MENVEKNYRELQEISTGVVNLYLELARLEKEGKKESQEYENLVSLLPKVLEIEKRKYLATRIDESYITRNKELLKNAERVDNILLVPSKELLVALRMLNFMDPENYYSLLDSTSKVVKLHYYMEERFLHELGRSIYKVEYSGREILLDYLYAILASSCTYGVEKLEPFETTFSLDEQDQRAIKICLEPQVQILNEKLFSLTDEDFTKDTVVLVVYLKAILYFHPYGLMIYEENNNTINIIESFDFMKQKCGKVLNLLYLLKKY